MPNPSADYPAALHTRPDLSAVGNAALGDTTPKHTEVHGKIEEEVYQIQRKLGKGDAAATSAAAGEVLTADGAGNTAWVVPGFDQGDLDASLEALTNKLGGGTPTTPSQYAVLVGTDTGESEWRDNAAIRIAELYFGANYADPRILKAVHQFVFGYPSDEGAGFEFYDFAHATRPGEISGVFGGAAGEGVARFIHFDGTDYNEIFAATDKLVRTRRALVQTPVALADASHIVTDASLGNTFMVTIAGNRTMDNPSNLTDGQKILYRIDQGTGGSRLITWDTKFHFSSDVPQPTLSTSVGARDYVQFIFDSGYDRLECLGWSRGY